MSKATPPVALSFREFWVNILKPENDGDLELVKSISCSPNTAGLTKQGKLLEVSLETSHIPLNNGVLHCLS